jgi:hypothetical protein
MLAIIVPLTVKGTDSDLAPPCRTCALPDVELRATVATTCVSLQLTTVASLLPSHTVPCADPKFEPEIVTCAPGAPASGDRLEMLGAAVITAKETPLLATPLTVTTT